MCDRWLAIESAPRDGTPILVFDRSARHDVEIRPADGEWWHRYGVGPTHWMPLPSPPSEAAGPESLGVSQDDQKPSKPLGGGE